MCKRFAKKVAVITGSANGIGRETALVMAREGATVVIADVDSAGSAEVVNCIREAGGKAIALEVDVLKPRAVDRMVKQALHLLDTIHILVNNVGGSTAIVSPNRRLDELQLDEWEATITFNLRGTFLCTTAMLPLMKAQRYGRIVNLSSILARGDLEISNAGYAAAKAAIRTMTQRLALEVGPFGITCNAVAPGITLTERIRQFREARSTSEFKMSPEDIPLKRLATPEEQAKVIAFLASDDAAYVSGQTIEVTGGR
jgi:NAD(P)-dependent dehydrogenase (short-subunit alcohol dehydrogenase family)